MFTNVIQSEECIACVPTCNGHFTFNGPLAVCTRITGICRHFLEVCRRSFGPPEDHTGSTVESRGIIEAEEMLLLQGPYLLLGSRISAWQIFQISMKATNAIRVLHHPTSLTELKSTLRLCNFFGRFVPRFTPTAAQLKRELEMAQPFHFGRLKKTKIERLERLEPQF